MAVRVTCSCGHVFDVDDQFAGQALPCPSCGNSVQVPAAGPVPQAVPVGPSPSLMRLQSRSTNGMRFGIYALVAFFVAGILAMIMGQLNRGQGDPADSTAAIVFLVLDVAGMTLSILAIIFAAQGMKQENTVNRGSAIAGLVMGITGAVLGTSCNGLVLVGALAALSGRRF